MRGPSDAGLLPRPWAPSAQPGPQITEPWERGPQQGVQQFVPRSGAAGPGHHSPAPVPVVARQLHNYLQSESRRDCVFLCRTAPCSLDPGPPFRASELLILDNFNRSSGAGPIWLKLVLRVCGGDGVRLHRPELHRLGRNKTKETGSGQQERRVHPMGRPVSSASFINKRGRPAKMPCHPAGPRSHTRGQALAAWRSPVSGTRRVAQHSHPNSVRSAKSVNT